jgi:hypothetical protein
VPLMPSASSLGTNWSLSTVSNAAERSKAMTPTTFFFLVVPIHRACAAPIAVVQDRPDLNPYCAVKMALVDLRCCSRSALTTSSSTLDIAGSIDTGR